MNSLVTGWKAAALYLDPAIQEAHRNGVSAEDLITACLASAFLALRSVNGDTPERREEAFLELGSFVAKAMEACTAPNG